MFNIYRNISSYSERCHLNKITIRIENDDLIDEKNYSIDQTNLSYIYHRKITSITFADCKPMIFSFSYKKDEKRHIEKISSNVFGNFEIDIGYHCINNLKIPDNINDYFNINNHEEVIIFFKNLETIITNSNKDNETEFHCLIEHQKLLKNYFCDSI